MGEEGLRTRLTSHPSTMTLGGLLKHLAGVEDYWMVEVVAGRPPSAPWAGVDWRQDSDWDWHSAQQDTGEQLRELWTSSVERSRAVLAEVLAAGEADPLPMTRSAPDGRTVSLRWVLTHLVEEYARHNGHADLLREQVDGQTGD